MELVPYIRQLVFRHFVPPFILCLVAVMLCPLFGWGAAPSQEKLEIRLDGGGEVLVIKKKDKGKWKAYLDGEVWSLKRKPGEKLVFKRGEEVVAKGLLREGKLKLKDPYGYNYAKIKFKGHKIKIYLVSSYSYDLKPRDRGWKVSWGDIELGEIVRSGDEWRALDASDQLKAAMSGEYPPVVLAPFLMDGVDLAKRISLCLVLIALQGDY